MAKGIVRSSSNYKRVRSDGRGSYYGGRTQSTLHSYKKTDLEYTLLVLKEVGKAVYPPAALAIEVLYQLYTHADAIKDVASAVMEGDYKKAAAITTVEVAKEVGKAALGVAEEPIVTKASNTLAEAAAKDIGKNVQEKEITSNVVKGTVRGVSKVANKKIVDGVTNEVLKWKEEK